MSLKKEDLNLKDEEQKSKFFEFTEKKKRPYSEEASWGIFFFYLFSFLIISTTIVMTFLYSTNISFFDLIVYPDLSFEYLPNKWAIWLSFSFLIFYLILDIIVIHWIFNIRQGMYSEKQYLRRAIFISTFFLFIPGYLIYISKYNPSKSVITEEEIDFLNDTKYAYSVKKLKFMNNLKDNSILVAFSLKLVPKKISRKFLCLPIIIAPFMILISSSKNDDSPESIVYDSLISTSYIDLVSNESQSTTSVVLDSTNSFLKEDTSAKMNANFTATNNGYVKIEFIDYVYFYDMDGDGLNSQGEPWYVNSDGIPVAKKNSDATKVIKTEDENGHFSIIPIGWISSTFNPYSHEYYFNVDIGFSTLDGNIVYEDSFEVDSSPYERVFQYDQLDESNTVYYRLSIVDSNTDIHYYFSNSSGNQDIEYNIDDTYTSYIDWNNSFSLDSENNEIVINPILSPSVDSTILDPYIEQDGNKIMCYRPMVNFTEYIELNKYESFDFSSRDFDFPNLDDVSSAKTNNCPDFYVPFGTEYRLPLENVPSYSNAIDKQEMGYLQVGINVGISDDYNSDVVYSNYDSANLVTSSSADLNFNKNLPIAGINNSCGSYSSYDSINNRNMYYNLDSTATTYNNSFNGNSIELVGTSDTPTTVAPNKNLCINVLDGSFLNYKDASDAVPYYYGQSRNYKSVPLYDFNNDGDYSWFSDNTMSFSLNNSFVSSTALPLYGAPAENIYNEITYFEYQILFLEIFPFVLLIIFFSLYIFDKNYVFAINETKRAWIATRSLLDTEIVSYAFKKWKKGETIDFDNLEEEMLANRGIDTKLDF